MEKIASRDGTEIAFARSGKGPPLVLVHGTTADHTRWNGLLPRFEETFTVLAMDRRGRGASGDAPDYALDHEFDDVAAVLRAAGSGVSLLGHSFGALCAMEAALRVDNLRRMVLYEPVFRISEETLYPPEISDRLHALFDSGDRDALLGAFFRDVVGMPDDQIEKLREDPSWPARVASAHTALREMAEDTYEFRPERFAKLNVPTLLLIGETSPDKLASPSRALHAALPESRLAILTGQGHVAMTTAPAVFLDAVLGFLSE